LKANSRKDHLLNGIEYFDIYRAADLLERINVNLSNK